MALRNQPCPGTGPWTGISPDWVYCLPGRHGEAPYWERHTYAPDGSRFDCVTITRFVGPPPAARDIQGWVAAALGYAWTVWTGPPGGHLGVVGEGHVRRPNLDGLLDAMAAADGWLCRSWRQLAAGSRGVAPMSWWRRLFGFTSGVGGGR